MIGTGTFIRHKLVKAGFLASVLLRWKHINQTIGNFQFDRIQFAFQLIKRDKVLFSIRQTTDDITYQIKNHN